MTAYLDLPEEEQVALLRPAALAAAAAFGLPVRRMEVAAHAYNTTFAVETTDDRRVALRVGTNSKSTPAHVLAQQSWLEAIAAETDVVVPVPLRTTGGGWYAEAHVPAYGRALLVTAASWLAGPDVEEVDVRVAHALGRTTALLHRHAEGWTLPPRAEMPRLDTPLFGDEDLLDTATWLSVEEQEVLRRSREQTAAVFARLHADADLRPLHADLHGGNLKWDAGRLAVFDLDDCGLGLPVLDLAITAFYLRDGDPEVARAREEALHEGYAEVAPLPAWEPADLEAMVAARQLLLANSLLATTTAELRGLATDYLHTSATRLRAWLETGVFTRAT